MRRFRRSISSFIAYSQLLRYRWGPNPSPRCRWRRLSRDDDSDSIRDGSEIFVLGAASTRYGTARARRLTAALEDTDQQIACGVTTSTAGPLRRPVQVVAAGFEIGADPSGPVALSLMRGKSLRWKWRRAVTTAPLASGGIVAITAGALAAGFKAGWSPDSGLARLAESTARRSQCVVVWSVVSHGSDETTRSGLDFGTAFIEGRRREGQGTTATVRPPTKESPGFPAPPPAAIWVGKVGGRLAAGNDLSMLRPAVCIRHAATNWAVADHWGDHHFAEAVRRAIETRGIGARVVARHAWFHPFAARDLIITIRGLHPSIPVPGRINVLWLISHPTEVTAGELDEHDLIAVASTVDVERIRAMTDTPVIALLQATDWGRFGRPATAPSGRVVFVGNSRGVPRPSVLWAIAEGLDPWIAGSGWKGILPAGTAVNAPVPNQDLPNVLAQAGIVLADHWDDMRRMGYVSNRLFDALAAGSLVITDPVVGLEDVIPNLPTYETAAELGHAVRYWLDPANASERAGLIQGAQALIRTGHTFDQRVDELLAALVDLVPGGEELAGDLSNPQRPG